MGLDLHDLGKFPDCCCVRRRSVCTKKEVPAQHASVCWLSAFVFPAWKFTLVGLEEAGLIRPKACFGLWERITILSGRFLAPHY